MMSGPLPDEIAAVMRAWRSLALIRSSVTSAPRALEASGICLARTSSAAGTKSFQRRRWSLVPCARAGGRRHARYLDELPSIHPRDVHYVILPDQDFGHWMRPNRWEKRRISIIHAIGVSIANGISAPCRPG